RKIGIAVVDENRAQFSKTPTNYHYQSEGSTEPRTRNLLNSHPPTQESQSAELLAEQQVAKPQPPPRVLPVEQKESMIIGIRDNNEESLSSDLQSVLVDHISSPGSSLPLLPLILNAEDTRGYEQPLQLCYSLANTNLVEPSLGHRSYEPSPTSHHHQLQQQHPLHLNIEIPQQTLSDHATIQPAAPEEQLKMTRRDNTSFCSSGAPTIKESLAALAAAAKLKRMRTQAHNAQSATVTRIEGSRKGDRLGGSIEFESLRPNLPKYNSCSTLFIDSTMSHADLNQTLKCVSIALVNSIRRNIEKSEFHSSDIFSEQLHPLSRMLTNTQVTLHTSNWARIVLGGLLLASKVWDDHAVWNIDFCQIFPDVDVADMNELERWYMSAIQYNVSVKASLYARYYFELRDLADAQLKSKNCKPLSLTDASLFTGKLGSRYGTNSMLLGSAACLDTPSIQESNPLLKHALPPGKEDSSSQNSSRTMLKSREAPFERRMKKSHSDYVFIPVQPPAQVI
ncbi:hypothetical protein HDU67_003829, partial [Dinochytrium kinnereticum]